MSKQAKVLNEAEIKRLKAVINDNRYAVRNMSMFVLALNVGLRAKELASIKVSDVLTDNLQIRDMCVLAKEQTKRDEANRIFFNTAVKKQLAKYFADDAYKHLQHKKDSTLFITKNNYTVRLRHYCSHKISRLRTVYSIQYFNFISRLNNFIYLNSISTRVFLTYTDICY